MPTEELKKAVAALLEALAEARPDDARAIRGDLRARIAEMRALGAPVPADLLQFEDAAQDGDAEDDFDNMPV